MEQEVRFCTTSDGVRIAYATAGSGHPVAFVPTFGSPLTYAEYDPMVVYFNEEMAAKRRYIRYDRRGSGMSDRDVRDFSRGALVRDLEAVIDDLKLRQVTLYTLNLGGFVAIEYAFRHPEKVSRLILHGCFARGRDVGTEDMRVGLTRLIRGGWDIAPEMMQTVMMPGADPESARRQLAVIRDSCSGDVVADQIQAVGREDVTDLLPEIKAPTLVLHARRDRLVPFELGRRLASLMPNARLVALDSDAHWDPRESSLYLRAIDDFLGARRRPATEQREVKAPTQPAPLTILFTDIEGSTALTQRLGDAKAQELLREHNAIVRDALKEHGGDEIKHTGDGIMASFSSTVRALACAIAIQRAFTSRAEDVPLRVRVGLNAGEPVAEDEDLFGTAVQLAARVCAHAEPGQIVAANVVRQLAAGKGFLFSDMGDVTLRGFEDPVRLYAVRWGQDS